MRDELGRFIKGHKLGFTGKHHSEETRKKMSIVRTGETRPPLTEEHKRKISEANMGRKPYKMTEEIRRKMSLAKKGIISPRRGTKLSKETRKKMSEARMGTKLSEETKLKMSISAKKRFIKNPELREKMSERQRGEKSHFWKGGVLRKLRPFKHYSCYEYDNWRKQVFERDNFTCQKYKIKGGKLIAHHIQNFATFIKLRFIIENGITLSEKAHREFHKIYGVKNNTREQLEEFLLNPLKIRKELLKTWK